MADFLSNLVARTLRQTPMLERRRPSLYEVQRIPENTASSDGFSEAEERHEVNATVPRLARPAQPVPREEPKLEAHSPEFRHRQPSSKPDPDSISRSAVERRESAPPAASPVQNAVRVTEQQIIPERTVLREKHDTVREVLRRETERIVNRERVETHTVVKPVPTRASLRLDATAREPHPASRVVERVVLRERPGLPKPVSPVHAETRKQQLPKFQTLPVAEPATPSVSISIGRVEIRAAQPSAPSSLAKKPAGPKVSLDDYLRRRNGGSQ